jgi:hypothetical protein
MANKKKSKKLPPAFSYPFVTIDNKSYGNALKGIDIFYEGERPRGLQDDGRISFGKHILEQLIKKFGQKIRWIITQEVDSINQEDAITYVRTSRAFLARLNKENFARTRDIKNDILARNLKSTFPDHFQNAAPSVYVPNSLAQIVNKDIVNRLSSTDRDAINAFLPDYLASESAKSVNLLKATAQIDSLTSLADELEHAMQQTKSEAWWQNFVRGNILLIQQGYIKAIEKMNVAIGNTKFPDFLLVTHDSFLDIFEIKKPSTPMLKHDPGRDNYFWDNEISRAIIQVENYISQISEKANDVRAYILDDYQINLSVVRPRGIILVGDARQLEGQKEKNDLRLLTLGLKNITIVTYDELLTRLRNYIKVLEETISGEG